MVPFSTSRHLHAQLTRLMGHLLRLQQIPWRVLAGWAGTQWLLLATSLLCRAWNALGVVLLGMRGDGAGLVEEVSAAELSLRSEKDSA